MPESEKIIAVGDIHGCCRTAEALLKRLEPFPEHKLLFIGDYIDRGPCSRDVVTRLIRLGRERDCIFLRGNHEQMMLDAIDRGTITMWLYNGGYSTLRSYGINPGLFRRQTGRSETGEPGTDSAESGRSERGGTGADRTERERSGRGRDEPGGSEKGRQSGKSETGWSDAGDPGSTGAGENGWGKPEPLGPDHFTSGGSTWDKPEPLRPGRFDSGWSDAEESEESETEDVNEGGSKDNVSLFPEDHMTFYRETKLYHETGNYLFVHGGAPAGQTIRQTMKNPEEARQDFLWGREHLTLPETPWEKIVVFGHTPRPEPVHRDDMIGIDTGCVYPDRGMGKLTAVILPEERFIYQKSLD